MLIIDATVSHSQLIPYLFPSAIDVKSIPALYLSISKKDSSILGAGILCSSAGNTANAYVMDIVVLEQAQEALISRQLMQHIINEAKNFHAPSLQNLTPVRGSIEKELFRLYHFDEIRKTTAYDFDLQVTNELLMNFVTLLRNSKSIPETIEILSYSECDTQPISTLCHQEFGFLTHGHLQAIGVYKQEPGWDFSASTALFNDNKLIASLAVGVKGNMVLFDPLLITESQRCSWAFPLITQIVNDKLLKMGAETGRALIHNNNTKMIAFINKIAAKARFEEVLFEKNLRDALPEVDYS